MRMYLAKLEMSLGLLPLYRYIWGLADKPPTIYMFLFTQLETLSCPLKLHTK